MGTEENNPSDQNADSDMPLLSDQPLTTQIDLSNKEERKKELLKLLLLAVVAFLVFTVFSTWPSLYTAVGGVLTIVSAAKFTEWISAKSERLPCRNRGVLITGCDTGFGNALANHLSTLGANVFATCLNESGGGAKSLKALNSPRMHVLQMDVTNTEQISKCFDYVKSNLNGKGMWGLVNNAGLNFLGSLETTSMEQYERVVNINQLGMVRVTKTFLPLVRKSKGRIVNVTSVKGRVSEPLNAAYGMTKFAGESFSDILRMEMRKFGVTVCIIEPGDFGNATGCLEMNRIRKDVDDMWQAMDDDLRAAYGREFVDAHIKCAEEGKTTSSMNIQPVIEAMTDSLFALRPKARYLIPGSSRWYDFHVLRVRLSRWLPEYVLDGMWEHDLRKYPLPTAVLNDPSLVQAH